jgi:hypothetical protein
LGRHHTLQLTIMSAEIVKSSLSEDVVISMSCAASELPKYNCTLILRRKDQDLGPIGYLNCDAKRPLISALANLTNSAFDELIDLVRYSPPRQPAFYLKISDIQHFIDFAKKNERNLREIPIYDLGWRFPLI